MGTKLDKRRMVKKGGRRKPRTNAEVCADRYSHIDIGRVCKVLGLIPIPENVTVHGLVDLWNNNTDYDLPRHDDRGKDLRTLSKPKEQQEDEARLWAGILKEV